tara:strand:- start:228 stop:551 length:324 start_codon:yes stop_codon:yes gene_type:complete
MVDLEIEWGKLIVRLEKQFDSEMTLKGILYLIGVQELNFGEYNFDRNEKLNVLHVAVCKILVPFGYYRFSSIDSDGWPHYEELKVLKNLSESEQEALIKRAILKYIN